VNLIEDAWIPVVTRKGRRFRITPWQLTEGFSDDPVVMIAAPRPDFTGALLEFLIGLVQTEIAPETEREWAVWRDRPPASGELRQRLSDAVPHFFLDGDGPRFMQSLDEFEGKDKQIGDLVIDDPPTEMVKRNTDHFIKKGRIEGLCPGCTATALYAANIYSPAAGRGHRTSLRGGGPVTTVVQPDPERNPEWMTLWHRIWSNVVSRRMFSELVPGNDGLSAPGKIYPWLAPTRTSEDGESTTPLDMSPFHVFWGMPRRIGLGGPSGKPGVCDLCGVTDLLFAKFSLRHGGMNHEGAWVHPLTPYGFDEAGQPMPFHMPRGGLGYRNWAALVIGRAEKKVRREPAGVVRAALRDRRRVGNRGRVAAFGYDVDNAKIRGWYEYALPVYQVDSDHIEALREAVSDIIGAADMVKDNLRSAIKEAWGIRKAPDFAASAFFQETEPAFHDLLDRLVAALGNDDRITNLFRGWHAVLCDASEKLFETWAEAGDFGQVDPGRIARAHLALRRFNWKKSIRDALRLPEIQKQSKRKEEADGR
jgi:CRISPR system Cascade subunit CasA